MKPRLAESGPALWAAVKELNISGVVPPGGGVYYPVIRIVAGPTFVMDVDNNPKLSTFNGIGAVNLTGGEADELASAIMMDQVEVLILTRPGYESGYSYQKTKMVLHSPSGNSFK